MCEALNCRRGIRAPRHAFMLLLLGLALPPLAVAQEKKETSPKLLDLNTATVEQLEELPEIGPTTAKAIVRFREKSGPFRRVEDLLAVRGITKRRLEKIRPLVTVMPPAKPEQPSASTSAPAASNP